MERVADRVMGMEQTSLGEGRGWRLWNELSGFGGGGDCMCVGKPRCLRSACMTFLIIEYSVQCH